MNSGKIIILLLLLWLNSKPIVAQENDRTNFLVEQIQRFSTSDFISTLKPSDTLKLIQQMNYANTIVMDNQDSAVLLLEDVFLKSKQLHYYAGMAAALTNLARVYNVNGAYEKAIAYHRQAEPYAIKGLRSRTSLAMFYSCASAPFYNMSRFDSMYHYVIKAEQLIEGINCVTFREVIDVSAINNNIAAMWAGVANYDKAIVYLKKSLKTNISFPKNRDRLDIDAGMIYANIGVIYFTQKKYDSAHVYLHKAHALFPNNVISLMGMGELKSYNGKYDTAVALFQKAITVAEKAKDYNNILSARAKLGILYFQMEKIVEAEILLNDVVGLSMNKGNIDLENTCKAYEILSSIAAKKGNYRLAYEQEQQSLKLLDSLKVKERMLSVYNLEAQLGAANKDKMLAKQQLLANKTKSNLLLGLIAAGVGIVFLGGLFLVLYRNTKNKQRLQLKELNVVRKEQEIKDLQSMIKGEEKERTRMAREIHDGIMVQFSTIKMKMKSVPEQYKQIDSAAYLATDYYRQLVEQMEDATRDLRSTAHNLMPDMLLQGGLEDAVLYFCNGLKRSTGMAIEFQKHGTLARLDREFELSVYRITQELLQNAIKHANATHILVQMTMLTDDLFTLTVEDNGQGFVVEEKRKGLGLVSINNRLKVMNGIIDISSHLGQGTSVHIEFEEIPLAQTQIK